MEQKPHLPMQCMRIGSQLRGPFKVADRLLRSASAQQGFSGRKTSLMSAYLAFFPTNAGFPRVVRACRAWSLAGTREDLWDG